VWISQGGWWSCRIVVVVVEWWWCPDGERDGDRGVGCPEVCVFGRPFQFSQQPQRLQMPYEQNIVDRPEFHSWFDANAGPSTKPTEPMYDRIVFIHTYVYMYGHTVINHQRPSQGCALTLVATVLSLAPSIYTFDTSSSLTVSWYQYYSRPPCLQRHQISYRFRVSSISTSSWWRTVYMSFL
jgi:hypothetical protein